MILGPKSVGKKSSAAFSMTSRSKIGSFHEDLQKVCVVPGGRKLQNTAKFQDKIERFLMWTQINQDLRWLATASDRFQNLNSD